jgi:hypothetical protein
MQSPRMTTRRWMIVLLALAFVAFVMEMERRASVYRRRAYEHYLLAGPNAQWKVIMLRSPEEYQYHIDMMRKWKAAQRHPWLSVEPDPPAPGPTP